LSILDEYPEDIIVGESWLPGG